MPVEIKELVIRAVVSSEDREKDTDRRPGDYRESEARDALVAECVKEVLKILRKSKER